MKPSEIYALPDIGNEYNAHDIFDLINGWHCHIPEFEHFHDWLELPADSPVKIRLHVDPYIDGDRCCTIGSVWLHDAPFMIFRHAGRSGHDQYDRFITDYPAYGRFVEYLRTLMPAATPPGDVRNADEDIPDLDYFYGSNMTDLIAKARKK